MLVPKCLSKEDVSKVEEIVNEYLVNMRAVVEGYFVSGGGVTFTPYKPCANAFYLYNTLQYSQPLNRTAFVFADNPGAILAVFVSPYSEGEPAVRVDYSYGLSAVAHAVEKLGMKYFDEVKPLLFTEVDFDM